MIHGSPIELPSIVQTAYTISLISTKTCSMYYFQVRKQAKKGSVICSHTNKVFELAPFLHLMRKFVFKIMLPASLCSLAFQILLYKNL